MCVFTLMAILAHEDNGFYGAHSVGDRQHLCKWLRSSLSFQVNVTLSAEKLH